MTGVDRVLAFGPGRVNLIGEHTDYNDGLALPFAISQGVTVRATRISGSDVHAHAVDPGEHDRFALEEPTRASGWRGFVRGAVAELRAADYDVPAAQLEITGTVPQGAGLSSSAALEVALGLALHALGGNRELDRLALAKLCSRIENVWVGASTGLLDQLAVLFSRSGHALRIDFRSLKLAPVPFETSDWKLVTVDSGEARSLADSGYNERRAECEGACERLHVSSLRDVAAGDLRHLPEPLDRRVRHVLEENARVQEAVEALGGHDLPRLAELLDRSHASLRDLYDSSTPAVEATVGRLKDAGAAGARMVGGGFGGHVLALYPPDVSPPGDAQRVEPGPAGHLLDAD
jgi:galactokinase